MLESIITERKALFETAAQTVLRGQTNHFRTIILKNGAVIENSRSDVCGISAKVYKNGSSGFASVAEFSAEAAEKVLRAASENALFLDKYKKNKKLPYSVTEERNLGMMGTIVDLEQKLYLDLCHEIDSYIAGKFPDIISRTVQFREDSSDKIICTSDAGSGRMCYPRCAVYVHIGMLSKGGQPVTLLVGFVRYGNLRDNFAGIDEIHERLDLAYRQLRDKAEGIYPEAGEKTVILGPDVSGMMAHEAVGHTLEADLVMGGSVGASNLGKMVASEKISIVDVANQWNGGIAPLPVYMDDEGVIAKDSVLIENGVLKGFMHNRETADHFGVEPCGNARAWEFSDEPIIRMRNTFIKPGNDRLEDMISSVEDGYYIVATGNGQADLTGEFMFAVDLGYEIKNGKIGRAILDTTVSGVAFNMLKTVDMVSDSFSWDARGVCGKKQMMTVSTGGPAIKCKINFGGR